HFVVERSIGEGVAADFRALGRVPAQQRPSAYEWPDPEVRTGIWYYYRLKQVDQDGTFTYSPIRSARITGTESNNDFFLYPNPVAERLTAHCTSGRAQKVTLIIHNMEGRTIRQRPVDLVAGQNPIPISVQALPPGVYGLQLVASTKSLLHTARFIKINRR
ncbi:MAG: T9SS type A sorting domain-containing protein, partial [Bacteroidota bacterium]